VTGEISVTSWGWTIVKIVGIVVGGERDSQMDLFDRGVSCKY